MAEIYRARTFDGNSQPHLIAVERVLAHLAEDDDLHAAPAMIIDVGRMRARRRSACTRRSK